MKFESDTRPRLTDAHLANAKLYADRYSLIKSIDRGEVNRIAEIGVGDGAFSEFMVDTLKPQYFAGFDLFNYHELDTVLGQPASVALNGLRHDEFLKSRLSRPELVVETYAGDSSKTLRLQPDKSFDLIYIDGSHTYEGVLADTIEAIRMVEQNGILIFNDYTMYDHYLGHRYGVVEVVNQLVYQTNFKVFAFALQADMFCDIAVRRL